ncbi:MAG: family N-acetyltransferase [Rhizobium sp.]|nr:family N-acetyltransferase [Rhizobium sp.]
MDTRPSIEIVRFGAGDLTNNLAALADILHASVEAGASINFILPYNMEDAADFWTRKVLPALEGGKLVMLVAWLDGRIAGTVQLDHDMPPNQRHRAELRKLMVHPDFRNRGIARALMVEIETIAGALERSLITLDTRTGDKAEPLYASLGYLTAGVIPGYCRDTVSERMDGATFMYKQLKSRRVTS